MRKRRRLADKLTIMVCAVLVAVSAFFYAPMDVDASVVDYQLENSGEFPRYGFTYSDGLINLGHYNFGVNFDSDKFYKVDFVMDMLSEVSVSSYMRQVAVFDGNNSDYVWAYFSVPSQVGAGLSHNYSRNVSLILSGSVLNSNNLKVRFCLLTYDNSVSNYNVTFKLNCYLKNVVAVTGEDSATYQQGYNAGYSVGEEVGESNGYSSGYSDGFEAGEQSGYDSGFESGKESVDTQSYYDMGYSAGYDSGYLSGYDVGYDDGYDAGWQAYEDKISGWGADTSDYPILKYSFFEDRKRLYCDVFTSAPSTSYDSALLCYLDFDIDSNHTYKFSVKTGGASGGTTDALYSDFKLNFVIGSNVFNAHNTIGNTFDFFIPGNNMGSTILLEAFVYDCVYYGGPSEEDGFLKNMGQVFPTLIDCYIDIYDMGPSGDTQNHIANQTDQLIGGYNDSQGNSVNNDFSSGINEFETAEDSLFATATTGLKDFTFFDIQSVPAMVTGMSFVGSIMSGWFSQAGGASGVGIVLSILFSIMLVAMVLGLYRWYQSKGGKD